MTSKYTRYALGAFSVLGLATATFIGLGAQRTFVKASCPATLQQPVLQADGTSPVPTLPKKPSGNRS